MAHEPDIAAVAPALELTLDHPGKTLRCAGTLDGRTQRHVMEAVGELLVGPATGLTVDVACLTVADVDGANTFARIQRMAQEAGVRVRWQGLDSEQLRGILPLRSPARRPAGGSAVWDVRVLDRQRHPSAIRPPALGDPTSA